MKISPSIYLIQQASGCNVYLVSNDDLALIDAGTSGNLEAVEDYMERLDRKIEALSYIFLTHSHLDHISSAPEIADKAGAKIFAHELDSPYISGRKKRGFFMRIGDFISRKPEFNVDVRVKEGEEIGDFKVIHTPGHTEGSASFLYEEEGALFVGDAIRSKEKIPFGKEGKLSLSPSLFSESVKDMKNSVKRIREIDPDLLLPGHGPPISEDVSVRMDELIEGLD